MPITYTDQLLLREAGRLMAVGHAGWPPSFGLNSPQLFGGTNADEASQLIMVGFQEAAYPGWGIKLVEAGLARHPYDDRLYFVLSDDQLPDGPLPQVPDGAELVSVRCDGVSALSTEVPAEAEAVVAWRRWAQYGPEWKSLLTPARDVRDAQCKRLYQRMQALMALHPNDERVRWLERVRPSFMSHSYEHGLMLWLFLQPLHGEAPTDNPFAAS